MSGQETHFLGQVAQKALIERDGKFLFLKYPSHDARVAGCYDIPGGRLNEGDQSLVARLPVRPTPVAANPASAYLEYRSTFSS